MMEPEKMRRAVMRALLPALALLPMAAGGLAGSEKQPVYVGARVCGECHAGPGMGNQYSAWLLSKHSAAYAALGAPEAKPIALLSGIPGDPQKAPACLGCHATAFDAEEWEKDPTFRTEDGIQCERCHGPGSEYMPEEVMRDPEASRRAGLRIVSKTECEKCHYVKGSHVAVHKRPKLDLDEAMGRIAHPGEVARSESDRKAPRLLPSPLPGADGRTNGPRYVGSLVCARCHEGPTMGYQFSRWRIGPHALAFAVLATPEAARFAEEAGVEGSPQFDPRCLKCHVTGQTGGGSGFLPSFVVDEGVGCEACHGPGSEYIEEAIMRDSRGAAQAGLITPDRSSCLGCHEGAHGKPFDLDDAMKRIVHPTRLPPAHTEPAYKTPVNLAQSPDGREIYVACEASGTVVVVDAGARRAVAEIGVGGQPHDVAFSPDGARAYVSNRLDDTVSVIDVRRRAVIDTVPAGDDPHGLLIGPEGKHLYVLDTSADRISVIDTGTLVEIKKLAASRRPWSLSMSPDGEEIYVTNNLSRFVEFRTPPRSEVTVIDAAGGRVKDRRVLPQTNLLMGVDWHPSGEFAIVTLNRTKNLVPMTRLLQGWTITNGIGILWRDGRVDQVLLDEPNSYFPDATDVAVTPDGKLALVTSAGSDQVAVVDIDRLVSLLRDASDSDRRLVLPNHLGLPTEFVLKRVSTRNSPRGIIVGREGRQAWVANSLDDSLTVIDLESLEAVDRVDLGGPAEISKIRRGERLFNSANISFQRQFSCHSCHPDGHVDAITYDIEADGIGNDPVDNRTLRGILDTDPFKWTGLNKTLSRQCGPRLSVFFTRLEPFTPDELDALTNYIETIPRPPNRHRPLGADLTPAQRRGKRLFERTVTNDGRVIPEEGRCITCHFPPLYTDRSTRDVGTKMPLDTHSAFDVPHLANIYDSAPYLHNGIAETLEEIWTVYNPDDRHGVTNDMTKDQLNDLIEYIKTL